MTTSDNPDDVQVQTEGGCSVLTLQGTVGIRLAAVLQRISAQLAEYTGPVEVHCGGLEHLDTVGIQLLLALKAARQGRQRITRLVAVPEKVSGYLRAAGVDRLLLDGEA